MGLLGNDFWDDIVDINDKHKRRRNQIPQQQPQRQKPAEELDKKGVSGITILYRTLGSLLLIGSMVKSWFWGAATFDWALIVVGLILIGVHRRLGAYYVIERVKPAFLDLHERLAEVENKLNLTDGSEKQDTKA